MKEKVMGLWDTCRLPGSPVLERRQSGAFHTSPPVYRDFVLLES